MLKLKKRVKMFLRCENSPAPHILKVHSVYKGTCKYSGIALELNSRRLCVRMPACWYMC